MHLTDWQSWTRKTRNWLDMFNKGLEDIKANGTYDEIIAKYLGE